MVCRYALDTGVANLVALNDTAVLARLDQAEAVFVPFVVIGELYFGAYMYAHHHNSTKYLDLYDDFLLSYRDRLLTADVETGQIFGAIRAELTTAGRIIQYPDMWVAAPARQYGLTVRRHHGCRLRTHLSAHPRNLAVSPRAVRLRALLACIGWKGAPFDGSYPQCAPRRA